MNIDLNTHADTEGNFQYNYIIPPGTQFGEYALTTIGAVSKVQLYQAFRWDGEITASVNTRMWCSMKYANY